MNQRTYVMIRSRGCRLGISRPEITEMQVMNVQTKGLKVFPEISYVKEIT